MDTGVVMPVYTQRPDFLHQALESVLQQSLKEFHLIIVIDGDPDMLPLVRLYTAGDPRVSVISHSSNKGVAHALNTGFNLLFTDERIKYLTWVSSDNVYNPRFLELLRAALAKGREELGLVYSSFQSIDNNGKQLNDEHQLAALRQYQSQPKEKLLDSSIIGVSFMYKAGIARLVGDYGMQPVEDYDYWLRMTEYCDIRYIPVELMNYRVNSSFSVSAQLLTTEHHRRWRYMYHLTRLQARNRRNIHPVLTVLYPVEAAGDYVLAESFYEQTFSNYIFRVLDLSLSSRPSIELAAIAHPTTDFSWMPGAAVQHALYRSLEHIGTPFTMILGPEQFKGYLDVQYMLDNLILTGDAAISNYYTDDHTQIGYRHKSTPSVKDNLYNELFRTDALKELLGSSI
ncbi:glycosyltransferase family A protein [Paenibacillus sp. MMS20-IR301]|uniref:glycosyltransferase family 2 protein n=1 Tax=Paenibacillus sp. MMS20-IR301 TaxID=2895946 RepID=UPI0028F05593|nr:glycosyltransferase family A protein [Paenibacillus sp. MMS20-IR301]WNS41777.1 glycosyltransferase family A protein [Paenibacillus sp. MMS20-IR301]